MSSLFILPPSLRKKKTPLSKRFYFIFMNVVYNHGALKCKTDEENGERKEGSFKGKKWSPH
jgi:hypothetical protein